MFDTESPCICKVSLKSRTSQGLMGRNSVKTHFDLLPVDGSADCFESISIDISDRVLRDFICEMFKAAVCCFARNSKYSCWSVVLPESHTLTSLKSFSRNIPIQQYPII